MTENLPTVTEADIRRMSSEQSFERGTDYYHHGALFELVRQGNELRAYCEGSSYEPYRVSATLSARGIEHTHCTCPYDWGGICKHRVALLLAWMHEPEAQIAQATQGFQQALQFMPPEAADTFKKQFLDNFEAGVQIAVQVEALPTRLPKGVDTFFQALSGWVHRPLAMLGGFLGYGIWVMLAAKLLGGKGRLQEFLGTAALSSVPYLLLILQKVPCLGSVLGIVAWIWSAIILIVATAAAHGWAVPLTTAEGVVERYEVSWGRAVLAVILPVLALAVLVIFGVIVFAVIITVAT